DQEVKAALKSAQSSESARPRAEPPRPAPPKPAPKPAAAPPPPVAKPISKPISAPIRVPPQRTPSAPIHGARPPSAPVAAAGAVSAPMTIAQVPKLLKETEVYVKYGLNDKALEHLRRVFSVDRDNIDDDEFAGDLAEADFYIQAGLPDDARAILEGIILSSPNHTGASQRLRKLGKATQRQAPAADKEYDDMAAELAAELAAEVGTSAD